MDNITHTLIGVAASNAGLKQRFGRGTTLALVVASNITDIDVFWGFVHGGEPFLYRRMLTHSVVGLPLLALTGGLVFRLFYRNLSWGVTFGLFLFGTAIHVFFDFLNSFGVVLLYPFSRDRFELGWVFIVDLAIWAILLAPLIFAALPALRPRLSRYSRISVLLLSFYVLFCGLSRWWSGVLLSREVRSGLPGASFTYVFPEALGPHRFRGAARKGDDFHLFLIYPLQGRLEPWRVFHTEENSTEVQTIRMTEKAKELEWFFKAPVWIRGNNPGEWTVFDLRFGSAVIDRPNFFSYRFHFDKGQVTYVGR